MKYCIVLGDGLRVPTPVYVAEVKRAIAHPTDTFSRSLRDRWPATGAEIRREFFKMVEDHCNRGLAISSGHEREHYVYRRIRQHRLIRRCAECGQEFEPWAVWQRYGPCCNPHF